MTSCDCPTCQLIRAMNDAVHDDPSCACDVCTIFKAWKQAMSESMLVFPAVSDIVGFNKDEVIERMNSECANPPGVNEAFADHIFQYMATTKTTLTATELRDQVAKFAESPLLKHIMSLHVAETPTHLH